MPPGMSRPSRRQIAYAARKGGADERDGVLAAGVRELKREEEHTDRDEDDAGGKARSTR